MDWTTILLTASLFLNTFLLNITARQAKDMSVLKRKQLQTNPLVQDDELVATLKEKIDADGIIPAIRYLRERYNMTLVEAKQLVDHINEKE